MTILSPVLLAVCAFTASALRTSKGATPHKASGPLDMEDVTVTTIQKTCEVAYDDKHGYFPLRQGELFWRFKIDQDSQSIVTRSIDCPTHSYYNRNFPAVGSRANPLGTYRITATYCYDAVQQLHVAMNAPSIFPDFYTKVCSQFEVLRKTSSWTVSEARDDESEDDE
ncbi:hypothetical protein FOZ61_006762 [Perkinsus olseni]|uniref:Uncharacterized protein n=1 Tax=Perkinsus olseni TaxID=32597 RepID=A0A7J6LBK2_PEROL|nr:hypothetical protein FOZ61_006762 [Perkinsus olseni]KAF4660065.1 hypothetical protein FOL46_006343 [Perkinsus olseni]